jgi:hypothetical protein
MVPWNMLRNNKWRYRVTTQIKQIIIETSMGEGIGMVREMMAGRED